MGLDKISAYTPISSSPRETTDSRASLMSQLPSSLVELCLNARANGPETALCLGFLALSFHWHIVTLSSALRAAGALGRALSRPWSVRDAGELFCPCYARRHTPYRALTAISGGFRGGTLRLAVHGYGPSGRPPSQKDATPYTAVGLSSQLMILFPPWSGHQS
jgi:hypothetical protein